ncbi:carboxypeptidase-like regulatory domain-containing protein [Flintibacter sp. KGMB00164]|uniref:MSCRAMM family protein n=1 Tax=Flintibacter sp. KGMB00164 TaxID=2610895 RepID=UPI000D781F4F|nr:carboxypeptidase-like regulatory domain-containing protein [Flintibacter sp. KGMB00164]
MADITQDLLQLQYSQNFPISGMQEADINLTLPPVPTATATVFGTVTDGADPIPDATVKLFDSLGAPYQHTVTDENGAYTLEGIPAGTYTVAGVKDGYLLSDGAGVVLSSGDTTQVNLVCTQDASLALGTIAGVVQTLVNLVQTPLSGAKISLLNAASEVVATTYSVDDGEFAFYDLADGAYTLIASAAGYITTAPMAVTILDGSIANVVLSMTVDSRTYNGTVSGIIRDQNGNAVAGCFVGLFQVAAGQELLIATTKTNTDGKYLFGGVTSGEYLVKAKMNQ